jgi:hypothetical protein
MVTGARAALVVLGWCIALASCDQFARVGVEPPAIVEPGPPAAPERDAGIAMANDAAAAVDATVALDASAHASSDAAVECPKVDIAICDPVVNLGCSASLMQQCTIDYLGTLTGYCIFSAPPMSAIGGECLNTGVTESCPPTSTCYEARCQRICLCDADCGSGQCCGDAVESTGFRVCGDC